MTRDIRFALRALWRTPMFTSVAVLMLAVIAILPIILGAVANMNISMGGTSIIIVVGVALDTARSLESQMMMRHYKGFLE